MTWTDRLTAAWQWVASRYEGFAIWLAGWFRDYPQASLAVLIVVIVLTAWVF